MSATGARRAAWAVSRSCARARRPLPRRPLSSASSVPSARDLLNLGREFQQDRYEEWIVRGMDAERQSAVPPEGHMPSPSDPAFQDPSDPAVARVVLTSEEEAAAAAGGEARPEVAVRPNGEIETTPATHKVDELGRAYGTGRRKEAVARVWIRPGTGVCYVNRVRHNRYFGRKDHREWIFQPFEVAGVALEFDVWCTVAGGGHTGQAAAARLGVARALQAYDPSLRVLLKRSGMLTRDHRAVEPKKPGRVKARKSATWVKR